MSRLAVLLSLVFVPAWAAAADPALFPAYNTEGKGGFIDATGRAVIPFHFEMVHVFNEGLALVQPVDKEIFGFIDTTGKIVIPAQYISAAFFSEGLASVERDSDKKWGFIDKTGKVVIPFKYDRVGERFVSGANNVELDCSPSSNGELLGCKRLVIDKTGRVLFEAPPTSEMSIFSEGWAMFKDPGEGYNFVNTQGKILSSDRFQDAAPFSEGVARVRQGKYGYIDKAGKWVIPPTYFKALDFIEGLAPIQDDKGHWQFIDHSGKVVVKTSSEEIGYFNEGRAAVQVGSGDNALWGFIDKTGKMVIPARYSEVVNGFYNGIAVVVDPKTEDQVLIDKTGREVFRMQGEHMD
jgi:hypothetical protein